MNPYIFLWLLGAAFTHVLLYKFTEPVRDQLDYPVLSSGLVALFAWPGILPILLMLM